VGACVVANVVPGNIVCVEAYGAAEQTAAPQQCMGNNNTWMAGVTCAQALPGGVNVGCAFNMSAGFCSINYYACLASCLTCNASSTTCVVP
jgi:hypothetical protein